MALLVGFLRRYYGRLCFRSRGRGSRGWLHVKCCTAFRWITSYWFGLRCQTFPQFFPSPWEAQFPCAWRQTWWKCPSLEPSLLQLSPDCYDCYNHCSRLCSSRVLGFLAAQSAGLLCPSAKVSVCLACHSALFYWWGLLKSLYCLGFFLTRPNWVMERTSLSNPVIDVNVPILSIAKRFGFDLTVRLVFVSVGFHF